MHPADGACGPDAAPLFYRMEVRPQRRKLRPCHVQHLRVRTTRGRPRAAPFRL